MKRQYSSLHKSSNSNSNTRRQLSTESESSTITIPDDVTPPARGAKRSTNPSTNQRQYELDSVENSISAEGYIDLGDLDDSQPDSPSDFDDSPIVTNRRRRFNGAGSTRITSRKTNTAPCASSSSSTANPGYVTIVDSESDDDGECEEIQVTTHEEKDISPNASTKTIKEFECPICFDIPDKTIGLACGHVYCFGCLFEAFSHSSERKTNEATCALCRKKFTLVKAVPLVFKIGRRRLNSEEKEALM